MAGGNTATPAPVPAPTVPNSITNFQARAQAIADGNFAAVDGAVRSSLDATTIAAWDYANVFERSSRFIAALQAMTPYNTGAHRRLLRQRRQDHVATSHTIPPQ